ncbi:hypothetical protein N7456_004655 [Penicillium angulare]|uniref:Uncharacterized protein n=1 Tax=Penicillium angulare TaxID=116970 RepID=A0A9W9FX01_9EURO|nr:hypothetical protein N7456_004655 [Penicillium angulare]
MLEDTNALTGGFNDADSLIHLWYSVLLPHRTVSELALRVLPLIREACRTASEKKTGEIFEKTWVFSHGKSLHLSLKKEDWVRMRALCHVPQHLTKVKASAIRTATMMSEERRDFRDRWAFKEPNGSTRLAKQKFREDGLLLPFAHNRAGFDVPNP